MSLVSGNVLVPAWVGFGFFVGALVLAVALDMVHNFLLYYKIGQNVRNRVVHILQHDAIAGTVLMQGAMTLLFAALVLNVGQYTRSDGVVSPWIIFVCITGAGYMLARLLAHFLAIPDAAWRANAALTAGIGLAFFVFASLSPTSGGRWLLWGVAVGTGSYATYLFHSYAKYPNGHAIAIFIVVAACFAAYSTIFVLGYTQTQQILFINELWSYWALGVAAFIIVPAWALLVWENMSYAKAVEGYNPILHELKASTDRDGKPITGSVSFEAERSADSVAAAAARAAVVAIHDDPAPAAKVGRDANARRDATAAAASYAPVRQRTLLPNI